MKISQAIAYASQELQRAGVKSTYLEARILLGHSINQPLEYLLAAEHQELSTELLTIFFNAIKRRMRLEPIAYIVGYKEFYGYKFAVNNKVLIPRPDTEVLIDAALALTPEILTSLFRILDLGTGSGCIIITLLLQLPFAIATAIDISIDAIKIATNNAEIHNVAHRLKLIHGDWFHNIAPQKFDLIVSNPPYIADYETSIMTPETILHEPTLALFADNDGYSSYNAIAGVAKHFLAPNGKLLLEVGYSQAEQVIKIFNTAGYNVYQTYQDLAGHTRAICFN
ncbi:Release factor glutamine methyltransferase [Candidatus Trichorickettsia mobilis]|uniref:Release factor glutamine methyltransferase n=1 Tax=Candidatus Trichorickettsia mobilis TaxID=1346319 RepID=A0ABZ0UUS4_9RICK|nr:peptide chain release factor N(5)-glutamine methyltransferase [Candidatus Trichorickettsia mobilis]WPY01408.1 Release factor glutamine methyltransferase [Candidatus Trichorickettsia mobilis]